MDYSTYRLSFPDGTYYIGSTQNTYDRFQVHKSKCKSKTHGNHKLQTAWTTFGNPDLQILNSYSTREEAFEAEQEILNEFYGTEECLNLSSSSKPFWKAEEHKARMSAILKGKPKSAEIRAKMSASHKGKPKSAETRMKMSASRKGKVLSIETKAKMSKPKSEETRAKMSLAKSKSITIGALTFSSITEASNHFQVSRPTITQAVKRGSFRGMKVE